MRSIVLVFALLAALPVRGVEEDLTQARQKILSSYATSELSWPAGRYSLADICTRLSVVGTTTLRLGENGGQTRELPAYKGPYWEGVLAVCEAYGLRIDSPRWTPDPNQRNYNSGRRSPSRQQRFQQTGPLIFEPVTLVPDPEESVPFQAAANGPLLTTVGEVRLREARRLGGTDQWIEICTGLRMQPGMPRQYIHEVQVDWHEVKAGERRLRLGQPEDALFQQLEQIEQQQRQLGPQGAFIAIGARGFQARAGRGGASDPRHILLAVNDANRQGEDLSVQGRVKVTVADIWERSLKVETDQPTELTVNGETYSLVLYSQLAADDNSREREKSKMLIVTHTGERALLGTPTISVQGPNGSTLRNWQSGGSSSNREQRYTFSFQAMPVGTYTVKVQGTELLKELNWPIACTVEMP